MWTSLITNAYLAWTRDRENEITEESIYGLLYMRFHQIQKLQQQLGKYEGLMNHNQDLTPYIISLHIFFSVATCCVLNEELLKPSLSHVC